MTSVSNRPYLASCACLPPRGSHHPNPSAARREAAAQWHFIHGRPPFSFRPPSNDSNHTQQRCLRTRSTLPRGLLFGSIAYTRRRLQLAFPSSGLGRGVVQLGPAGQGRQARSTSHKRDAPPVAIYWGRRATAACRWGSGRLCYGGGAAKTSAALPTIITREIINSQKLRKAPPRGLCQSGLRADPRTTHITVDLRTIWDRGPLLLPLFSWVEHPTL